MNFFFFHSVLIGLLILSISFANAQKKYVPTPFGLRLEECIIKAGKNSKIVQKNFGKTIVVDQIERVVPEVCHREESWIRNEQKKNFVENSNWGPSNYTCNSLPCNDWMDNAGWLSSGYDLRAFSSFYVAPQLPLIFSGQTLFYFIGLENTDGLARHGPNRIILQVKKFIFILFLFKFNFQSLF